MKRLNHVLRQKFPEIYLGSMLWVTIVIFLFTPPVLRAENKVKIRTEYNRTLNTPNHFVFVAKLHYIEEIDAESHDNALQIVRRRMHLYDTGADEAFLARMLEAATALRVKEDELTRTMLCDSGRSQSRKANFQKMDALDDLRESVWHNSYIKFVSQLNEKTEIAFLEWLQASKQGFYYRTSDHESMYESSSLDVLSRVEDICLKFSGEAI